MIWTHDFGSWFVPCWFTFDFYLAIAFLKLPLYNLRPICVTLLIYREFSLCLSDDLPNNFSLQQGQRQDILSDTFWLMTFFESAALIGGQVLANWLVGIDVKKGVVPSSTASVFLSILGIICVSRGWTENPKMAFDDYRTSFFTYIFGGKGLVLL